MANPNIVAVTNILGGNLGWNLSATATTTLLTVDAEKILKINRITVANVDGTNPADVSLYVDGLTTAPKAAPPETGTPVAVLYPPAPPPPERDSPPPPAPPPATII